MALSVEWTPQAEKGLDKVLEYLEENGMEKEILNLEKKVLALTERISKYPKICPQSEKHSDHYLARFKRKTLCYSKSVAMVNLTLLLFFVPLLIHLSFKDTPI